VRLFVERQIRRPVSCRAQARPVARRGEAHGSQARIRAAPTSFERTTRRLRLTEEGRTYLTYASRRWQALDDAGAALQAGKGGCARESADPLRAIWSPRTQDLLDEFSKQYPEVEVLAGPVDSLSNLLQDDIDLAIRFGVPPTVLRRQAPGANRRVLCASPRY